MAVQLTCYGTEDGEPWAVFADGHIDPSLITIEAINDALDYAGFDPVEGAQIEHLWIAHDEDEAGEEGLCPWRWCESEAPGALAITGVKFA